MTNEYASIPQDEPEDGAPIIHPAEAPPQAVLRVIAPAPQTGVPAAPGQWKAGIVECLSSVPNTGMSFCLPCVPIAQVASRVGILGGYYVVLVTMVALHLFGSDFDVYFNGVALFSTKSTFDNESSLSRSHAERMQRWRHRARWTPQGPSDNALPDMFNRTFRSYRTGIAQTTGFSMAILHAILLTVLRSRVRRRFRIPGNALKDFMCSCCCSTLVIAQLATQVETYPRGAWMPSFGPRDVLPPFEDGPTD